MDRPGAAPVRRPVPGALGGARGSSATAGIHVKRLPSGSSTGSPRSIGVMGMATRRRRVSGLRGTRMTVTVPRRPVTSMP